MGGRKRKRAFSGLGKGLYSAHPSFTIKVSKWGTEFVSGIGRSGTVQSYYTG